MDKIGKLLYEQVYLFFLKDNSNNIVMDYIETGLNLIFNSDSLLITNGDESYVITVVIKRQKNIGIFIPIVKIVIIFYYVIMEI